MSVTVRVPLVLMIPHSVSFTSWYLEEFYHRYFEISKFDSEKTYDKIRTLFVVHILDPNRESKARELKLKGFKVVIDNLWERPTGRTDYFWLEHESFFLWNESLWWKSIGHESYRPNKAIEKLALMPLRRMNPVRDRVLYHVRDFLPSMVWSYVGRDRRLPYDDLTVDQRFMHKSWYDTTYCSLVVESQIGGPMFVTEKSYKPLAFFHPTMILGVPGTLEFLKSQGFETFDNLFDESYDRIWNLEKRMDIIKQNFSVIDCQVGYDSITLDKLRHNHDVFFNLERSWAGFLQHVVEPLIEYAEA
jgi:hypothetical protein